MCSVCCVVKLKSRISELELANGFSPEIKVSSVAQAAGNILIVPKLSNYYKLILPFAPTISCVCGCSRTQPALETQKILLSFYHWMFSRIESSPPA